MKLKIVTPERILVEQEVDAVYGNTVDGAVGILPRHIPLLTPLKVGVMSFVKDGRKEPLAVMGGLLYTDGATVTVLSDAAEIGSEIDTARAQRAKERAQALLQKHGDLQEPLRIQAKQALSRAELRLKLATKK